MRAQPSCGKMSVSVLGNMDIVGKYSSTKEKTLVLRYYLQTADDIEITPDDLSLPACMKSSKRQQ